MESSSWKKIGLISETIIEDRWFIHTCIIYSLLPLYLKALYKKYFVLLTTDTDTEYLLERCSLFFLFQV